MRGPEWDEPKSMEIDSILNKLMAAEKLAGRPADQGHGPR